MRVKAEQKAAKNRLQNPACQKEKGSLRMFAAGFYAFHEVYA